MAVIFDEASALFIVATRPSLQTKMSMGPLDADSEHERETTSIHLARLQTCRGVSVGIALTTPSPAGCADLEALDRYEKLRLPLSLIRAPRF